MYHFLSGYLRQGAGTEKGVNRAAGDLLSTCFRRPLHAAAALIYAQSAA